MYQSRRLDIDTLPKSQPFQAVCKNGTAGIHTQASVKYLPGITALQMEGHKGEHTKPKTPKYRIGVEKGLA